MPLIDKMLKLELSSLVTQETSMFIKEAAALIASIPTKTEAMVKYLEEQSWDRMLTLYQ